MDLDQLASRLAALETEVATLRKRSLTMKQTYRCVCGSTTLLHFKRIYEARDGQGHHALSAVSKISRWSGMSHEAPFEAYICEACGLTEWHVVALEELLVDGKIVERVTAPAEPDVADGPYR
ncbi:MAG TPA: hypothetical protein VGG28_01095 [Kofleriaceae bacterium]|jgi:hypothetical protein